MGIYERDNIPYQNIIDSMIRNRQAGAKIKGDNWRKQGEIWSNAVKELGSIAGRTMDAYQGDQETLEAHLAALEEERKQAELEQKYKEQVAQRRAVDQYIKKAQERQQGNNPFDKPFGMEEFYIGGIY